MATFLEKDNKIGVLVASIEEDMIYYFMALEKEALKKKIKKSNRFTSFFILIRYNGKCRFKLNEKTTSET